MRKPRIRPRAGIGAIVVGALALAGCSSADEEDTATPDSSQAVQEPVRYAVETPDHLIPGNHFASYSIVEALWAPLVQLEEGGDLTFLAAESVESDDAITWTITLRDGWTFHNGDPVTAQDYVDTWNYAAFAPNAWVNSGQLANIVGYDKTSPLDGEPTAETLAGLTVVDDHTFTVELESADRQYPLQLTIGQTALYPLPAEAFDDLGAFEANPIGNGPFEAAGKWTPDAEFATVAYNDYEGPEPTVDAITFVPYLDTSVAYTDALAGAVDIVGIAAGQAQQARTDFPNHLYELDAPGVDFLGFNLEDLRFADVRVRQAISMAIDREAINDAVFGGSQIPATSLTSPSMPGDPAGVCGEYCEFDPEAAQALLAEAGGFEGTMEILFIANWGQEDLFEAIANQIRQNLAIEDVVAAPAADFAAFTDQVATGEVNGPFRARWGALYPSQQNTLQAVYTSEGEGNFGAGGYSDPEVDALIAQANAAESAEDSYAGYTAVQERIVEDFPTIPLFGNRYLYVTSDRVAELHTVSGAPDLTQIQLAS